MKEHSMTMTTKTINGKLMIVNKQERDEFCKEWPDHTIYWVGTVVAEGSTEAQRGYYYNKVVPDFRKLYKQAGIQHSLQQMDAELLKLFYGSRKERHSERYNGFYTEDYKTLYQMSKFEGIEYLDFLRRIAAEEFGLIIEDPKRL